MKNRELLENYRGLANLQNMEDIHYRRTGEKLFKGRVKVTYAIKKNMKEFLEKLDPYNETLKEVIEEYRDQNAERMELEKLKKEMVTSPDGTGMYEKEMKRYSEKAGNLPVIMKPEKDRKEYESKINELLNLDVNDVNVHKISLEQLEGVELDSNQLDPLMFMIEE